MKPTVSIIVPVYNTEKYLQECIDSILAQTYRDFELILVDDGSKDSSGKICDTNALRDNRIRIIHQHNNGVTAARRNGLNISQGEWIHFVDSDDTIPTDSLASLVEASSLFDTDFVVGHFNKIEYMPPSIITLDKWRELCISGEYILPGPVARLIRKSLYTDWVLDIPREIVKGEDMLMNIRLAFNMTKDVVEVHKKVYNYRANPDSCVHTFIQDAEYEQKYHQLRMLSIPNQYHERYLKASVHKRVLMLNEMYSNNPMDASWTKSDFYIELIKDIEKTNYRLNPKLKLKLHSCDNRFYRKTIYLIIRCDEYIYNIKCRIKVFIKKHYQNFFGT